MQKQLCSFSNTIFISKSEKKSILATRQGLYEGQKTTVIRLIISRKNMSLGTCVSSTMYLLLCLHEWCFLCFPYILVDKVVVSAILFDEKSEQIRCYIRCINFATKVKCLICVTKHKWLSILHVLDQVKKCRIIRIVQLHDLL